MGMTEISRPTERSPTPFDGGPLAPRSHCRCLSGQQSALVLFLAGRWPRGLAKTASLPLWTNSRSLPLNSTGSRSDAGTPTDRRDEPLVVRHWSHQLVRSRSLHSVWFGLAASFSENGFGNPVVTTTIDGERFALL